MRASELLIYSWFVWGVLVSFYWHAGLGAWIGVWVTVVNGTVFGFQAQRMAFVGWGVDPIF
jgi:hypothetical protein